jgi:hypothetical protein
MRRLRAFHTLQSQRLKAMSIMRDVGHLALRFADFCLIRMEAHSEPTDSTQMESIVQRCCAATSIPWIVLTRSMRDAFEQRDRTRTRHAGIKSQAATAHSVFEG